MYSQHPASGHGAPLRLHVRDGGVGGVGVGGGEGAAGVVDDEDQGADLQGGRGSGRGAAHTGRRDLDRGVDR